MHVSELYEIGISGLSPNENIQLKIQEAKILETHNPGNQKILFLPAAQHAGL